ncbi:hypothetical protein DB346_01370 [Verrucomicrobia bacterium LW23]|nr:hypothetical protein DB346_01370 [Verrucomicrobia bacterium LW23]
MHSADQPRQPQPLAVVLIDALDALDVALPGFGLYASLDSELPASVKPRVRVPGWKVEYQQALKPRLLELGCIIDEGAEFSFSQPVIRLMTNTEHVCEIRLLRLSVLKVRKYGDGYQMDRHVNYKARWNELGLAEAIHWLTDPPRAGTSWPERRQAKVAPDPDCRIVAFLGFDKSDTPFRRELQELELHSNWTRLGIETFSRTWKDRYGRNFTTLIQCWTKHRTSTST